MSPSPDLPRPPSVHIATFGCKLNQYESEAILTQFRAAGYEVSETPDAADVCVVNTCSVTSTAERKARSYLRSARRKNPGAVLMAAGCMAERMPDALAKLGGIDAVVGNAEKTRILDYLPAALNRNPVIHVGQTSNAKTFDDGLKVEGLLGRTRSFLKVQDGCSQKCTYCIVPSLRGTGRSLDIHKAVQRAEILADKGFAEIVITGVALGTYGFDFQMVDGLAQLLHELQKIRGIQRIRLGSVEPWAISTHFLEIIANSPVLCPHLHIPLQSCDDDILRRMNRRYTVAQIGRIFDYAYRLRQDWGFGSDIIVGFPGETEEQHRNTRQFIESSPLSYLHVFPYSARPGTPATKLPDPVAEDAKKRRTVEMHEVDAVLRSRFCNRHLGTVQNVLFENRHQGRLLAGHGANYLDIYADAPADFAGRICDVLITRLHPQGVEGEIRL